MRKIIFIVNPISGIGSKASLMRYLHGMFSAKTAWEAEIYKTTGPGDAYQATMRYREAGVDCVVAVGGDGTVNQVARALLFSAIPMGIIPAGSGNGLARHLHIPLSATKAVEVIQKGTAIDMDSGEINGHAFFCTAGVGFDATVGSRFNMAPVRGLSSYLALSALEYVAYRPELYTIHVAGKVLHREAFLITFANCAQWGNNVYIAPGAEISDGLLDMVIWRKTPIETMPLMAMRLLMGNIDHSSHIESIQGVHFKIHRAHEGWVHFDGESCKMGIEIEVLVRKAGLRVIIP